jgi:hypothetical protein
MGCYPDLSNHLLGDMKPLLLLLLFLAAGCERNEGVPPDMDCKANLRQLDGAKERWALENHKTTNDIPTMAEITPLLREVRSCRSGGVYTIGRIGEKSKCSIKGHELP